jgi:predicted amidophosphoribosyltransferase
MGTVTAISAPLCNCCGIMFKSRQGENHFCGDCITQPKKFRIARAAVASNQQFMTAIHRFKYAGKIQMAELLGGLMLNAYRQFWEPEKFGWKSVSNPSAVELSAIPVSTDVLIKSKATIPQTGLGRQQRLINIKDAFRVQDPQKVNAKKVLLVDDVYTTGATVNECARVLLKAGAEFVDVLTVARAM